MRERDKNREEERLCVFLPKERYIVYTEREKELGAKKRKGRGIVMQMQLCFLIATSKERKTSNFH